MSILDRSKDIIISGGEVRAPPLPPLRADRPFRPQNASSLAIEQELASHPDVLEASVVARPHPKWGERAMAFVILRPAAAPRAR